MTEMTCDEVELAASEYALGILPADEARAVSTHLLGCPSCRREVEEIRRIGDQLLDLVPDAEPPLGLDQRVLSTMRPPPSAGSAWRPGRIRLLVTAAAAAALMVIASITAISLSSQHHQPHPGELTAVLREGNRNVGSIYVGGQPTWITMTVEHLSLTATVSCQLVYKDGTVADIGSFQLVGGRGTWGAPDPNSVSSPTTVRLVGPAGDVLATASLAAR